MNRPECGTYRGACKHRYRREPQCQPCQGALNEYQRRWRSDNVNAQREAWRNAAATAARAELQRRHPDEFRDLYEAALLEFRTQGVAS